MAATAGAQNSNLPANDAYFVGAGDDNNDLPVVCRYLTCAVAGVASVVTVQGTTLLMPLAAGVPMPIRCTRVRATGTTATGIVALT